MLEHDDFLCLKSDPDRIIGVFGGCVGEYVVVLTTSYPSRLSLWMMRHKDEVQKYEKPKTSA